ACAVAACGGPEMPIYDRSAPEEEPSGHVAAVAQLELPPRPRYSAEAEPVATGAIASTPGAELAIVATTEGAHPAAVTVDRGGAMRLWPARDGKREPVVVRARPATKLAIAREGDAFVIAGLDAVGQLELVRESAAGIQLARFAMQAPRPFVSIH